MSQHSTNIVFSNFCQSISGPLPLAPAARRVDAMLFDLRAAGSSATYIHIEVALRKAKLTRQAMVAAQIRAFSDLQDAVACFTPRIALVLTDERVPVGWAATITNAASRRWHRAAIALLVPAPFPAVSFPDLTILDLSSDWPRHLAQQADLVDL